MQLNRQVLAQMRTRGNSAEVGTAAPFGGWDTISSLADMPENCASVLDNWYPDLGRVRVRKGYAQHATGVGSGLVQTAVEYNQGGNRKLLAASSTNIYNATSSGAASSLASGFSNGKWQTATIIANQIWCNGADTPQVFDGTSFSAWTGTGPTPGFVVGAHVHKTRLYVWESNSDSFWYGAPAAIGGTFTEFDLGEVSQLGGNIVAMSTWTLDSGSGPDDLAVFFLSSGQYIVYAGNDPGDPDGWALVGIFRGGAPLGPRAFAKDGADVRLITHEDVVMMTGTMQSGDDSTMSTKVKSAISESVAGASGSFGWQICQYPRGGMVIHNIPQAGGSIHQYVQNMTTKAWCRYTGIEAQCWTVFDNELYFGGAGGKVFLGESGHDDNGEVIAADALTAWTRLGIPNRKRISAVRPLLAASDITYNLGLGYDFRSPNVAAPTTITSTGTPWGSPWGSSWSTENTVSVGWRAAVGTGTHVALRLRINTTAAVEWYRIDLRVEPGNAL